MKKCKNCRRVAYLERKLEESNTLLFAVVRKAAVQPLGRKLGKSEAEISKKTLEAVAQLKDKVDIRKMRELIALADSALPQNDTTESSTSTGAKEAENVG